MIGGPFGDCKEMVRVFIDKWFLQGLERYSKIGEMAPCL